MNQVVEKFLKFRIRINRLNQVADNSIVAVHKLFFLVKIESFASMIPAIIVRISTRVARRQSGREFQSALKKDAAFEKKSFIVSPCM